MTTRSIPRAAPPPAPREIAISAFEDDPFVGAATVERLSSDDFFLDANGNPVGLAGPSAKVVEGDVLVSLEGKPVAINPWLLPVPGGALTFDEARFPHHKFMKDAHGNPATMNGMQIWQNHDGHLGQTTAFEAVLAVEHAARSWAGRALRFGKDGQLVVHPHAFVDEVPNGYFDFRNTNELYFGVVPYVDPQTGENKIFEAASSWELVAHETGHAVHFARKPNYWGAKGGGQAFRPWGESFGDQMALWTSLQDPDRVGAFLRQTSGDLSRPSEVTTFLEAIAPLTALTRPNDPGAPRSAVNALTMSTTPRDGYGESQVLTGAAYDVFCRLEQDLVASGVAPEEAVREAAGVLGTFLLRVPDYVPENAPTWKDIAQGYLTADQELFGGRYHDLVVSELTRRELLDAQTLQEWQAHRGAVPQLRLAAGAGVAQADALVSANLDALGIGHRFGARVQAMEQDDRGQTIVRIQLTLGRGDDAPRVDHEGILVFRSDGTLASSHSGMPTLDEDIAADLLEQAMASGAFPPGTLLHAIPYREGTGTVVSAEGTEAVVR